MLENIKGYLKNRWIIGGGAKWIIEKIYCRQLKVYGGPI